MQQIINPNRRRPLPLELLWVIFPDELTDDIPVQLSSAVIDILLGSNYSWSMVDGGHIVLTSSLLLVSSKLGYILTGKYPNPIEKSGGDEISYCLVVNENNLYSSQYI